MAVTKSRNSRTVFYVIFGLAAILLISLPILSAYVKKAKENKVPSIIKKINYENHPRLGDANAKVKILLFEDFKCIACRNWEFTSFPKLKRDFIDTGKVQLYFINLPFIGPDSETAALAGEAIFEQNPAAFWKYYELMYINQGDEKKVWATEDFIVNLFTREIPQINISQFREQIKSKKVASKLNEDKEIARGLKIKATPTIYVDGVMVQKALDYKELSNTINASLEKR